MKKELNISIPANKISNFEFLKTKINRDFRISNINSVEILKKSLDARGKEILYNLKVIVFTDNDFFEKENINFDFKNVENAEEVHIIGAGPAGLFAALNCIINGYKPIIYERGKDVSERKKDVAALNSKGIINIDSNYCFGEGGAGTFSDGKLFTRSSKRGDTSNILKILVFHGADEEILKETHAHIGSDKLPEIIKNIRKTIIKFGGNIVFNTKIADFEVENGKITALIDAENRKYPCSTVILASGHSANDIYEVLHRKNILLEAKAFALGVRIEHPQKIIDQIQYHQPQRPAHLPTANYNFTAQYKNRGIFSFCMCPGGLIIPASSDAGKLVVNGMSNSQRNSEYANSGMVVTVDKEDFNRFAALNGENKVQQSNNDALCGLFFRDELEKRFFEATNSFKAPAQRMYDFINKKKSQNLNKTSYHLGIESFDFDALLPEISEFLRGGLLEMGTKRRGFLTNDAQLIGLESRTSSPVRIPRTENYHHVEILNLFPVGEGAGYAGGITSSAMDGWNCVEYLKLND